jgi:hypothetical protein
LYLEPGPVPGLLLPNARRSETGGRSVPVHRWVGRPESCILLALLAHLTGSRRRGCSSGGERSWRGCRSRPRSLSFACSESRCGMPRLLPSQICSKCRGPLRREPCLLGAVYVCERCDRGDPMDSADPWINGELKPPAKSLVQRPDAHTQMGGGDLSARHSD